MPSHSRVESRQNREFSNYKVLAIVLASTIYQQNIIIFFIIEKEQMQLKH